MSNLTRSFVRGFGSAMGFMAAKATVNAFTKPRVSAPKPEVNNSVSNEIPEEVKLSISQKLMTLIMWVSVIFLLGIVVNHYNLQGTSKLVIVSINIAWICLGWTIPVFFFSNYNEKKFLPIILQKQKELKEPLIREIQVLMDKISESPFPGWAAAMNENDRYDGDWNSVKYKYSVNHLQTIKNTFQRRVKFIDKYVGEFGVEKFKSITDLQEPTIGMTEKEFLLWKTNTDSLMQPFKDTLKFESFPENIEESVSEKNELRTLIYGTKKTGSYFKFKNSKLVSFTLRD